MQLNNKQTKELGNFVNILIPLLKRRLEQKSDFKILNTSNISQKEIPRSAFRLLILEQRCLTYLYMDFLKQLNVTVP